VGATGAAKEPASEQGDSCRYEREASHRQSVSGVSSARRLKTAIKAVRFVTRWGALFDNAISSALAGIAANRGAGNLSVWYSRPIPPSGVDAGNGSTNASGGADGTIINDNGDAGNVLFKIGGGTRAYFVPPHPGTGAVAHDVLTTDDYYCLAHQYPLRDWLPESKIAAYVLQESGEPENLQPDY
jgi:hypothetical protein